METHPSRCHPYPSSGTEDEWAFVARYGILMRLDVRG